MGQFAESLVGVRTFVRDPHKSFQPLTEETSMGTSKEGRGGAVKRRVLLKSEGIVLPEGGHIHTEVICEIWYKPPVSRETVLGTRPRSDDDESFQEMGPRSNGVKFAPFRNPSQGQLFDDDSCPPTEPQAGGQEEEEEEPYPEVQDEDPTWLLDEDEVKSPGYPTSALPQAGTQNLPSKGSPSKSPRTFPSRELSSRSRGTNPSTKSKLRRR